MKSVYKFEKIYLHRHPVDGRKWIRGLSTIIESEMNLDAFGKALFGFINKKRTTIKLVYWDRSGFALWMKQLEEEKFKWPMKSDSETMIITSNELSWLLDGIDILKMNPHATLKYQSIS